MIDLSLFLPLSLFFLFLFLTSLFLARALSLSLSWTQPDELDPSYRHHSPIRLRARVTSIAAAEGVDYLIQGILLFASRSSRSRRSRRRRVCLGVIVRLGVIVVGKQPVFKFLGVSLVCLGMVHYSMVHYKRYLAVRCSHHVRQKHFL
jgi:hypothetical protein